jgi:hypothetical protein
MVNYAVKFQLNLVSIDLNVLDSPHRIMYVPA